jgi:hypothetical protein
MTYAARRFAVSLTRPRTPLGAPSLSPTGLQTAVLLFLGKRSNLFGILLDSTRSSVYRGFRAYMMGLFADNHK